MKITREVAEHPYGIFPVNIRYEIRIFPGSGAGKPMIKGDDKLRFKTYDGTDGPPGQSFHGFEEISCSYPETRIEGVGIGCRNRYFPDNRQNKKVGI